MCPKGTSKPDTFWKFNNSSIPSRTKITWLPFPSRYRNPNNSAILQSLLNRIFFGFLLSSSSTRCLSIEISVIMLHGYKEFHLHYSFPSVIIPRSPSPDAPRTRRTYWHSSTVRGGGRPDHAPGGARGRPARLSSGIRSLSVRSVFLRIRRSIVKWAN